MTIYALKFVNYETVEDHLRTGWMVSIPNAAMHHHHYGIELAWLCPCPVPGGFSESDKLGVLSDLMGANV